MYAQRIDTLRKAVAVAFALCGLGSVILGNARYDGASTVLGFGALLSLTAVFGFFVEYLVRSRWEGRRGKVAAYQLTLAEMMVVIAVVALVLAVFRVLGLATIAISVVVVMLLACGLELGRMRATEEKLGRASDEASRLSADERK